MHQRHQSTFTNKNIWSDKYYIIGIDFLPLVGVDCRVMVRDPTRHISVLLDFRNLIIDGVIYLAPFISSRFAISIYE